MITGPRSQFEARCRERGYTLGEVLACIVSENGDTVTVDETHPAYPRTRRLETPMTPSRPAGAGTELKSILQWIGVRATATCPCHAHAAQMDAWGPDECERRMDEILGWLEAESARRGLPFLRSVAEKVVRLAIKRARKTAAA